MLTLVHFSSYQPFEHAKRFYVDSPITPRKDKIRKIYIERSRFRRKSRCLRKPDHDEKYDNTYKFKKKKLKTGIECKTMTELQRNVRNVKKQNIKKNNSKNVKNIKK